MAIQRPATGTLAAYLLRRAAVSIIVTVTILMMVPLWGIVHDPSLLLRSWEPWGWVIVMPYSVAVVLLLIARRLRSKAVASEAS